MTDINAEINPVEAGEVQGAGVSVADVPDEAVAAIELDAVPIAQSSEQAAEGREVEAVADQVDDDGEEDEDSDDDDDDDGSDF